MGRSKNKQHRKNGNNIVRKLFRRTTHEEDFLNANAPTADKSTEYARIYRSEYEYLLRCILEYPDIETGGQLFGFWTPKGHPVVLYAIGPGAKAGHYSSFFSQDIGYLKEVGDYIVEKFGLAHIGEWHSHHRLGLAQPSGHDASNMQGSIDKLNLGHFLLCIGTCTAYDAALNPFMFYQNHKQYHPSQWEIKDIVSPYRYHIDTALKDILLHPQGYNTPAATDCAIIREAPTKPTYPNGYWLNEKANSIVLQQICNYLAEIHNNTEVRVKLDETTKWVHIVVAKDNGTMQDICFPEGFPSIPPSITTLTDNTKNASYHESQWLCTGNICETFINYYQNQKI